jgi:prepilin-type N-terminal cleavage/methylation domain-containing protein
MNIKSKGFTLIELLVVVAIISLLSSVVLASVRDARNKANETKMVETIKQIQNSLELFKANTGHYPYGYLQSYFVTDWSMTEKSYDEDFSFDPNQSEMNKSPYLNLKSTFENITTEDGIYIFYNSEKYTGEQWEQLVTCNSDSSQTVQSIIPKESYSILVMYPSSYSLFRKFKEAYVVDYTGVNLANGYWVSNPTACFSTE